MLDSSKVGRISFFIFRRMIDSNALNHVPYDLKIAPCHCKVQRDLAFRLLQLVQQLHQRCELAQNGVFFCCDTFFQIDEIQLELWHFERGDWVYDLLVQLGDLLVFLHVAGLHQQTTIIIIRDKTIIIYIALPADQIRYRSSKYPINCLGDDILRTLRGEDSKNDLKLISAWNETTS